MHKTSSETAQELVRHGKLTESRSIIFFHDTEEEEKSLISNLCIHTEN